MLLRCALLASAVAVAAAVLAPASADTQLAASCDETNVRIYFSEGDAALSTDAVQSLRLAERQVSGCPYAELRVLVDASAPRARDRGAAILAAADGRRWNAARVERSTPAQSAGPQFAEVTVSPNRLPVGEPLPVQGSAGV